MVRDVLIELFVVLMGKRWLRYGLVGNFLVYGIGWGAFTYIGKFAAIKPGSCTTSGRTRVPRWMRSWPSRCLLSLMPS